MMKKWVPIFLIVSLLVSVVPVLAEETGSTIDCAEAHGLFGALGVISSKADTHAAVTRGEFSYYLARLFTEDSLLKNFENPFPDCSDIDDKQKGAIGFLLAQGAISHGTEFRPNEVILVCEAIKMTVCMAANKYLADMSGGWFAGYRYAANRADLLQGVSDNDDAILTLGDALNLMLNALECPEILSYRSNNKTYAQTTDRPLREACLNLYKEEGIITDNGVTSLYGRTSVRENEIVVNDLVFADENLKGAGLLGYDVSVYYIKSRESDKKKVVYIHNDTKTDQTVNFYSSDIVSYENGVYKYTYDEFSAKENKAVLADNYTLIYNNYAVYDSTTYSSKCMLPDSGTIQLIDNNRDNRYDVVLIEDYETWQISDIDNKMNIIYGKVKVYSEELREYVDELRSIDLDDAGVVYEFCDDTGAELTMASIMGRKNVISVAESLNGDYVKIIKRTKSISGAVSQYGDDYVVIDDAVFRASKRFQPDIVLNLTGKFWFDERNELVYFTYDQSVGVYAYLIDIIKAEKIFDDVVLVKVFKENGNIDIMTLKDNLTVDGERMKAENAMQILSATNKLIKISFDENNMIYLIDTVLRDNDTGMNQYRIIEGADRAKLEYYRYGNTLDGIAAVNTVAKVFVIPNADNFNEDQITVTTVADYFIDSTTVLDDVTAYTEDDSFMANALVVYVDYTGVSLNNSTKRRMPYIVQKVSTALNADGEIVPMISVLNHNDSGVYYGTDVDSFEFDMGDNDMVSLAPGDLIRFGYDKNGAIDKKNAKLVYDCSEEKFYPSSVANYANNYYNAYIIREIWAISMKNDFLMVSLDNPEVTPESEWTTFVYPINNYSIFVYDSEKKTVTKTTADDILTYEGVRNECTHGVLCSNYLSNGFIMIYR